MGNGGGRARIRTPARNDPKLGLAPTPARANDPPRGRFRPVRAGHFKNEILEVLGGGERFGGFSGRQLDGVRNLFIRYGFLCVKDTRRTKGEARNCFVGDLRRWGNASFLSARYILDVYGHLAPGNIRNDEGKNVPVFDGISIPSNLKHFIWGMSSLSSIFVPGQDMASAISLELVRAAKTAPRYHPYIIPQLAEKPWVVPTPDHVNAITRWRENAFDNRRRNRQEMSPQ